MEHLARENDWMDNWCYNGQCQLYVLDVLPQDAKTFEVRHYMPTYSNSLRMSGDSEEHSRVLHAGHLSTRRCWTVCQAEARA
jgi:hypothetical protein